MKPLKINFSTLLQLSFLALVLPLTVGASEQTGLIVTDMETLTAEDLVQSILGDGVEVSNVMLAGNGISSGYFAGEKEIIGFEEGIILSTGSIHNVVGPNTSNSISKINGLPGDPDLDTLIAGNYKTHDATVLEFDFVPEADYITFEYVFASDEYNQYVNTHFNDVFGFFINGENQATLPGTEIVVSINNVNGGSPIGTNASNPEYFRNNDYGMGSIDTEMDGLTVVLTVNAEVNAGEVNHIKMAIADVADGMVDSNVFIKAGSFRVEQTPPEEEEPEENVDPVDSEVYSFKITGGGTLMSEGDSEASDNRSFGFNIHQLDPGLHVNLQYNANHRGNSKNDEQNNSSLQISANDYGANIVEIENEYGEVIGVEFEVPVIVRTLHSGNERIINTAHVRIVDNGKAGSGDEFQLTLIDGASEGYGSGLSVIEKGNIKVHR